jgi:hypothetical protein
VNTGTLYEISAKERNKIMANLGQEFTKAFFENMGLQVKKIKENSSKSPDFEVSVEGELLFYCEEKTIEESEIEYLTAEELEEYCDELQETQNYGSDNDNTYDAMSSRIYKAIKQFQSINPNRVYPNVLAITNLSSSKGIHDLFISLTGKAVLEDGTYLRIHRVGRLGPKLDSIDLYLWFDKEKFVGCIWGEFDSLHDAKLKEVFKAYLKLKDYQ